MFLFNVIGKVRVVIFSGRNGMIVRRRTIGSFIAIGAAIIFMMAFAACSAGKKLEAGSTWEVAEITNLGSLTIGEGAVISAPEGKSVIMTVDGVETPIKAGSYKGKIVLTPAENIVIEFGGMGANEKYNYKAAINVENGKYIPGKSVAAAVVGGTVTDASATDVKITSVGENFNGIIVRSDEKATYSVVSPVIDFTGNGGNDFAGYGAAIMSSGKAEVNLEKAKIVTRGAVRTAIFVGGDSTMRVNDTDIEVYNGTLPANYEFSVMPGKMMEVPWMLGIVGNVRAINVAGNGIAYFENTHIKAQGWGCLSTDDVTKTRVYATNCVLETTDSGYGGFSLGGNLSTFSKCTFNVADYALISQDGDAIFTDGTVANSKRFGAMFFGSEGDLTIEKGTEFNTKSTSILMKSSNNKIVVDNAKLNPENGIILQVMANDDPYMSGGRGGGPGGGAPGGAPGGGRGEARGGAPGGAPAGGGAPPGGGMPGGAPPGGGMAGGAPGGAPGGARGEARGGAPGGGGMAAGGSATKDINATFSNMTLTGDIVNGNTAVSALIVDFRNATITGAITTAVVKNAAGPNGEKVDMNHRELYNLIGDVTNTYCATNEKFGVNVSFDEKSSWVVGKTSYLTSLTIAKGATIKAAEGKSLTMTVNGVKKLIEAGSYKGKIVITVI
jgi:hypothetical protein